VQRLRKAAGLTQEDLAKTLGLKKPSPISLMEGRRKHVIPKPSSIRRLAKALHVEPWQLLEGVETEYDRLRAGDPARAKTVDDAILREREATRRYAEQLARLRLEHEGLKAILASISDLATGKVTPLPKVQTVPRRKRKDQEG